MNNRQVAHKWAQQNGKEANGSNFYSRGDTIFSYGGHFPIARFNAPSVVLFTNREYGNATAKHKNYTRQAIPQHCTVFIVQNVTAETKEEHRQNFQRLKTKALGIIATIPHLRQRKAGEIDRAFGIIKRANEYAAHFKLGRRIKLPGQTAEDLTKLYEDATAKEQKANRERERRLKLAQAKEREEAKKTLAEWFNGGTKFPPANYLDGICFRLINDGADLQSTLGAEFPADHARRAWPLLQRIRATGEPWQRNGHQIHLGHFQIDRIETNGDVLAGCHRIAWEEVCRVADLLGMTTEGAQQPCPTL